MSLETDSTLPVSDAHHGEPGYETRDANVYALLRFGIGLAVAIALIMLAMLGLFRLFERARPSKRHEQVPENLYQQLRDLRRGEADALGQYRWINRDKGIVQVPIDRAIELVAEKGVRFGKGPKTELEIISHGGTPAPAAEDEGKDKDKNKDKDKDKDQGGGKPPESIKTHNPPEETGTKP